VEEDVSVEAAPSVDELSSVNPKSPGASFACPHAAATSDPMMTTPKPALFIGPSPSPPEYLVSNKEK